MSSEWINTTIGEQIQLQTGVDITKRDFKEGTIPVVSSGGIGGFHNTFTGVAPGVILGRKGLVSSVYYLSTDYWAHDTTLWVKDFKGNHPKYIFYFFQSMTGTLKSLDVGSANPTLNRNHVHPIETRWAPIEEQKAIAHILGTLDDKIELNRKTNETLEAMAKALFKSWFVDFDPVRAKAEGRPTGLPAEISDLFPDSFEDSELGEIPSGWEVGGLEEFLVLQRGFDLPAPQRIKGAYPVVAASGVSGTHNEPMAFAPGVVTGRSGVLGKVFYIQTDFFPLNTTLWAKEFRLATPIYGYFILCDIDFAVFNAGSAVPTLNRNHLGSLRFPLPLKALVVSFTEVAIDLMKRNEGIVAEISNLSATRDALLPKLISGEIRIPDAEKLLEEVGI
jgi:type I restriction enzyme S subunit